MWKTWLTTHKKHLLVLLAALLLLFCLWQTKHIIRVFLTENPEVCVLCGGEPREEPCLLDAHYGQVSDLVGGQVPGTFQLVGTIRAPVAWDSSTQTGWLSLPQEDPLITVPYFCRSCRLTIILSLPASFYLADLSDPSDPVLYPIEEGTLELLGWTITTEAADDGFDLTITQ